MMPLFSNKKQIMVILPAFLVCYTAFCTDNRPRTPTNFEQTPAEMLARYEQEHNNLNRSIHTVNQYDIVNPSIETQSADRTRTPIQQFDYPEDSLVTSDETQEPERRAVSRNINQEIEQVRQNDIDQISEKISFAEQAMDLAYTSIFPQQQRYALNQVVNYVHGLRDNHFLTPELSERIERLDVRYKEHTLGKMLWKIFTIHGLLDEAASNTPEQQQKTLNRACEALKDILQQLLLPKKPTIWHLCKDRSYHSGETDFQTCFNDIRDIVKRINELSPGFIQREYGKPK